MASNLIAMASNLLGRRKNVRAPLARFDEALTLFLSLFCVSSAP